MCIFWRWRCVNEKLFIQPLTFAKIHVPRSTKWRPSSNRWLTSSKSDSGILLFPILGISPYTIQMQVNSEKLRTRSIFTQWDTLQSTKLARNWYLVLNGLLKFEFQISILNVSCCMKSFHRQRKEKPIEFILIIFVKILLTLTHFIHKKVIHT